MIDPTWTVYDALLQLNQQARRGRHYRPGTMVAGMRSKAQREGRKTFRVGKKRRRA